MRSAMVVAAMLMMAAAGQAQTPAPELKVGDQAPDFSLPASVDPVEGEKGNKAFAAAHNADFPLLGDESKKTAEAYGVLNQGGMANRWTFYIGKDGKILAIAKTIKVATSAEDMAAKLGELKVDPAKP